MELLFNYIDSVAETKKRQLFAEDLRGKIAYSRGFIVE